MANSKEQKMAEFYAQCLKKGYTDMNDPTQSLKAKVIATDMGLNYGNMAKFFVRAKECHARQKKAEAEAARMAQEKKARDARGGSLLVTLNCSKETVFSVCLRPDGSLYTADKDGKKTDGVPAFQVEKGGYLSYTYNPSETVYTGATVGSVHTGGFHQTEASYSERVNHTQTGYILVRLSGRTYSLDSIILSDLTREKFRRDPEFRELASGGTIRCYRDSTLARDLVHSAMGKSGYDQLQTLTMAADQRRLDFDTCVRIVCLARRMANGQFPPDDEALYVKAKSLADSKNSQNLQKAMEIFTRLEDYRDARAQLAAAQRQYEDALQTEKEQAVLQKEKRRVILIVVSVILAVLILVSTVLIIRGKQEEKRVIALLENSLVGTRWERENGEYLKFYISDYSGNKSCTYGECYLGKMIRENPRSYRIVSARSGQAVMEIGDAYWNFNDLRLTLYYEVNSFGGYRVTKILDGRTEFVRNMN